MILQFFKHQIYQQITEIDIVPNIGNIKDRHVDLLEIQRFHFAHGSENFYKCYNNA